MYIRPGASMEEKKATDLLERDHDRNTETPRPIIYDSNYEHYKNKVMKAYLGGRLLTASLSVEGDLLNLQPQYNTIRTGVSQELSKRRQKRLKSGGGVGTEEGEEHLVEESDPEHLAWLFPYIKTRRTVSNDR